jgi:hypothetical protein
MAAKIRKATEAERAAYSGRSPLYGFLTLDGHVLPVEFPNEWDGPRYEAIAPKRWQIAGYGTHSMLGTSLRHLAGRVYGLEPCPADCYCRTGDCPRHG